MFIVRSEYEKYAKKIRTEKLSLEKVMGIFDRNPEFKKWYVQKFVSPR